MKNNRFRRFSLMLLGGVPAEDVTVMVNAHTEACIECVNKMRDEALAVI